MDRPHASPTSSAPCARRPGVRRSASSRRRSRGSTRRRPRRRPVAAPARGRTHGGAGSASSRSCSARRTAATGASCVDAALVFEELGAVDVAVAAGYFASTATMLPAARPRGHARAEGALARAGARRRADPARWRAQRARPCRLRPLLSGRRTRAVGAADERRARSRRLGAARDEVGVRHERRRRRRLPRAGAHARGRAAGPGADDVLRPVRSRRALGRAADAAGRLAHRATTRGSCSTASASPTRTSSARRGEAGALFAASPEIPIGLAASFVGLGRAAREHAEEYAAERVSWGVPIRRHQTVALRLAEAAIDEQAARLLVWDAAAAAAVRPVARRDAQGSGGEGVRRRRRDPQRAARGRDARRLRVTAEYRAARYLNDAWVGWSCDFTRDLLLLGLAPS